MKTSRHEQTRADMSRHEHIFARFTGAGFPHCHLSLTKAKHRLQRQIFKPHSHGGMPRTLRQQSVYAFVAKTNCPCTRPPAWLEVKSVEARSLRCCHSQGSPAPLTTLKSAGVTRPCHATEFVTQGDSKSHTWSQSVPTTQAASKWPSIPGHQRGR